MRESDEPGAVVDRGLECLEVEGEVVADVHDHHLDAEAAEAEPGEEVRVVLEDRGHDPVARGPGKAVRDELDRLCGVPREDERAVSAVHEPRDLLPREPVALGRELGQAVDPAPDVRAVVALELELGGKHRLGREARRGRIEVDRVPEDGEIGTRRGAGDRRRGCRGGCLARLRSPPRGRGRRAVRREPALVREGEIVRPAELGHLLRERLPPPEPPVRELPGEALRLRVPAEERLPPRREFGVGRAEPLPLGLEHGRAEVAAEPLEPPVVERVDTGARATRDRARPRARASSGSARC